MSGNFTFFCGQIADKDAFLSIIQLNLVVGTGTKPVKIHLTFSDDPTGEMFESISYQGNSVMNSIFGPLQKHTFNRIFKVHSRLHDLALALNRVEVNDGHIILYPRMGSTK